MTVRSLPEVHVVALVGELDMATADGLAEALTAIPGSLVIDLAGVTFMDSSGIAALVKTNNQLTDTGRRLVLTRPAPNVRKVLGIVGLLDWVVDWSPSWSA